MWYIKLVIERGKVYNMTWYDWVFNVQ